MAEKMRMRRGVGCRKEEDEEGKGAGGEVL